MIVYIDPQSRRQDQVVAMLEEWNQRDDLNITIWTNDTWMDDPPSAELPKGCNTSKPKDKIVSLYLQRQKKMAFQCMREMKRRDQGWTLLVDSDSRFQPACA
jgi:hypothetical protein